MPAYNAEKYIQEEIESVINKEMELFYEIIIGEDNFLNVKTRFICEEYTRKFPKIIKLMPKASNKGG